MLLRVRPAPRFACKHAAGRPLAGCAAFEALGALAGMTGERVLYFSSFRALSVVMTTRAPVGYRLGPTTGIWLALLLAGPAPAFPIWTRDPGTGIFSGSALVGRTVFNEASGGGAEVSTLMVPAAVLYSRTTNSAFGLELFYVERRLSTAEGSDVTRGAGDLMLFGRYKFLSRPHAGRWDQASVQLGLSVPTGATDRRLRLAVPAPVRRALQPGSGTTDVIFDVAGGRFTTRYNLAGGISYRRRNGGGSVQLGDELTASVDGEFFLLPRWTRSRGFELLTLLELSYVHRERTDFRGLAVRDSGGDDLLLAPGLQWIATERFLLEVSVQLPVF